MPETKVKHRPCVCKRLGGRFCGGGFWRPGLDKTSVCDRLGQERLCIPQVDEVTDSILCLFSLYLVKNPSFLLDLACRCWKVNLSEPLSSLLTSLMDASWPGPVSTVPPLRLTHCTECFGNEAPG